MKLQFRFLVPALMVGMVCSSAKADLPAILKPQVDPKLESVTAAQLLQLIRDLRGENGVNDFVDDYQALDQAVMALAHLGRYQMALQYTYKDGESMFDEGAPPDDSFSPELNPPTAPPTGQIATGESSSKPSRELASAWTRPYIYQAAIYRKVTYGKRAEARAHVSHLKQPEMKLQSLMWLGAAALRDGRRGEALADLRRALKEGGQEAAQHEWLALLLTRCGDNAASAQIFKARQRELEKTKVERERDMEDVPGARWGSLITAMWSAGHVKEALSLLKLHPRSLFMLMEAVVVAKDSPQKRETLKRIGAMPEAVKYSDPFQYLVTLPLATKPSSQHQLSTHTKARIEAFERDTLRRISGWDKAAFGYYDQRFQNSPAWSPPGMP